MKEESKSNANFTFQEDANIESLVRLATVVDHYRNFTFTDLRIFSQEILENKYGLDIAAEWWNVEVSTRRIEDAVRAIPGLERMWNYRSIFLVGGMMVMMITIVPIAMSLRNVWLFYVPFYISLSMLGISGALSIVSSRRLREYQTQHKREHEVDIETIRNFVQKLLGSLSSHFEKNHIDSSKYPFELVNADYDNIQIVGRSFLRNAVHAIVR